MYIVIELQTSAQGAVSNIVWAYASRDEAYAKYHAVLSAAAVSSIPYHACSILFHDGQEIANECFRHEKPADETPT